MIVPVPVWPCNSSINLELQAVQRCYVCLFWPGVAKESKFCVKGTTLCIRQTLCGLSYSPRETVQAQTSYTPAAYTPAAYGQCLASLTRAATTTDMTYL